MKTLAAWLRERLRCFLGFYTLEEEVRQLHNCVVNMKMKAIEKKALAIIQEKTHSPLFFSPRAPIHSLSK